MKVGGFIGIGLGGSASALKVKETCRVGSSAECKKVKLMEGGSFLGSVGGSGAGAYLGALGATPMCIAIGVGTLGVGGLVCGVVVVGAASAIGGECRVWPGGKVGGDRI